MRLVLSACLLVAARTARLSSSYTIEFYSQEHLINETTPGAFFTAKVHCEDDSLSEQERELRNVNVDGSDFFADGCTALATEGAREPSSGEIATNGFYRTYAFENGTRISLTVYIRLYLTTWRNATTCTVTARENEFRWIEGGVLVGNARRSFSIPIVSLPSDRESTPRVSPRVALAWLGVLALVLLLILSVVRDRGARDSPASHATSQEPGQPF